MRNQKPVALRNIKYIIEPINHWVFFMEYGENLRKFSASKPGGFKAILKVFNEIRR